MKKMSTVRVAGLKPELLFAIVVAGEVWRAYGQTLFFNSMTDGVHGKLSYHAAGYAVDLRLPAQEDMITPMLADLRERLGSEFDVILESDHIHIEFDVRRVK